MPRKRACAREYFLSRGICPQCQKNDLQKGETLCWECRAYNRDYNRIRYERNLAAGICTACNVRPVVQGKKRCKECADKALETTRKRYHRLRDAGICVMCGKRKAVNGRYCYDCYLKVLASNERRRKKKAA